KDAGAGSTTTLASARKTSRDSARGNGGRKREDRGSRRRQTDLRTNRDGELVRRSLSQPARIERRGLQHARDDGGTSYFAAGLDRARHEFEKRTLGAGADHRSRTVRGGTNRRSFPGRRQGAGCVLAGYSQSSTGGSAGACASRYRRTLGGSDRLLHRAESGRRISGALAEALPDSQRLEVCESRGRLVGAGAGAGRRPPARDSSGPRDRDCGGIGVPGAARLKISCQTQLAVVVYCFFQRYRELISVLTCRMIVIPGKGRLTYGGLSILPNH